MDHMDEDKDGPEHAGSTGLALLLFQCKSEAVSSGPHPGPAQRQSVCVCVCLILLEVDWMEPSVLLSNHQGAVRGCAGAEP